MFFSNKLPLNLTSFKTTLSFSIHRANILPNEQKNFLTTSLSINLSAFSNVPRTNHLLFVHCRKKRLELRRKSEFFWIKASSSVGSFNFFSHEYRVTFDHFDTQARRMKTFRSSWLKTSSRVISFHIITELLLLTEFGISVANPGHERLEESIDWENIVKGITLARRLKRLDVLQATSLFIAVNLQAVDQDAKNLPTTGYK